VAGVTGTNQTCLSGRVGVDGKCTCSTDDHCLPTRFCAKPGSTTAGCERLRVFGAACSSDRQCFTQRCLGGACRDCQTDKDCPRGTKCNAATQACKATIAYAARATNCSANAECRGSNLCLNGRCIACGRDADCADSPEYRRRWQCRLAANPLDNACLPVTRCFSDAACGIAASEDDRAREGTCLGKTCLMCAEPGGLHRREAAPFDITSSEGPVTWCNLQTNRYF